MITAAISPLLLADFSRELAAASAGRVSWLPITDGALRDGSLSRANVAVTGHFAPGTSFATVLPALTSVRWLHHVGAGMDRLLGVGLPSSAVVTNSAGAYAPSMAEYAIAGMIRIARGLDRWTQDQAQRKWQSGVDGPSSELYGARLGIVGYGAIGRHLATAAKALGMEVWATKRTPIIATAEPLDRLLPAEELLELLRACDFVVITASLNATTRHLFGDREFRQMKRTAVLVNMARGAIVDPKALAAALEAGTIRGALIDVTEPEPLLADSPLWTTPNLWITPHISGETSAGYARAMQIFCTNLALYLGGHPDRMGNRVDIPAHS